MSYHIRGATFGSANRFDRTPPKLRESNPSSNSITHLAIGPISDYNHDRRRQSKKEVTDPGVGDVHQQKRKLLNSQRLLPNEDMAVLIERELPRLRRQRLEELDFCELYSSSSTLRHNYQPRNS